MALKANKNGVYAITSLRQAKEALVLFQSQAEEAKALRAEHGIDEIEQDCVELKKAVTRYAVEHEVERIDFDQNFHATLVRQFYGQEFIGTVDDIPDQVPDNREIIPLQAIIEKKFKGSVKEKGKARKVWMRITKRIVDRAAVDQIVAEGVLTVDELAPCFIEKEKAPYLRIFEE